MHELMCLTAIQCNLQKQEDVIPMSSTRGDQNPPPLASAVGGFSVEYRAADLIITRVVRERNSRSSVFLLFAVDFLIE